MVESHLTLNGNNGGDEQDNGDQDNGGARRQDNRDGTFVLLTLPHLSRQCSETKVPSPLSCSVCPGVLHFVVTCGLVELEVFIVGLFYELHPNAYIGIFRSLALMFAIFILGTFLADVFNTARSNRELKKIQENLDKIEI
jgi:hypothetical protein